MLHKLSVFVKSKLADFVVTGFAKHQLIALLARVGGIPSAFQ